MKALVTVAMLATVVAAPAMAQSISWDPNNPSAEWRARGFNPQNQSSPYAAAARTTGKARASSAYAAPRNSGPSDPDPRINDYVHFDPPDNAD